MQHELTEQQEIHSKANNLSLTGPAMSELLDLRGHAPAMKLFYKLLKLI